jgi:hypothetical protein
MKKAGRHHEDDSFYDMCKYRAVNGTMKFPRTNFGKNQPLAEWVHYVRKRKARDQLAPRFVTALNRINFQWTARQSPRGQFGVRFAELGELHVPEFICR